MAFRFPLFVQDTDYITLNLFNNNQTLYLNAMRDREKNASFQNACKSNKTRKKIGRLNQKIYTGITSSSND